VSAARLALLLTIVGVAVLLGLSQLAGEGWPDVLGWAFVLLPIGAWLCAGLLYWAHRMEPLATNLGERSIVAIRDALVTTIGAVLGLNRVASLGFPTELAVGLLAVGLLLVAAYPLAWLTQFYRGRWD
jgi:hypothetical protein